MDFREKGGRRATYRSKSGDQFIGEKPSYTKKKY
jgi:hypothetical protein